MAFDYLYTNGVIAVKETALLGDTLYRLCEGDAATAFRILCERGFGGGLETASEAFSYEKLIEKVHQDLRYLPTASYDAFRLQSH